MTVAVSPLAAEQVPQRAGRDTVAVVEDHERVARFGCFLEVMGAEDDSGALGCEPSEPARRWRPARRHPRSLR